MCFPGVLSLHFALWALGLAVLGLSAYILLPRMAEACGPENESKLWAATMMIGGAIVAYMLWDFTSCAVTPVPPAASV